MGWDTESDPIQVSAGLEGGDVAVVWVGNVGGKSGERSGQQLDIYIKNSPPQYPSTPLAVHQQFKAPPHPTPAPCPELPAPLPSPTHTH